MRYVALALTLALSTLTLPLGALGPAPAAAQQPELSRKPQPGPRRAFAPGQAVSVLWGGQWWDGHVTETFHHLIKIRYDGWDASWDEWVEAARLRPRADAAPVDKGLAREPGQPVSVLWGGQWWDARVLARRGGSTLIHYDGYGPEWDEWVGPDRIRRRDPTPAY